MEEQQFYQGVDHNIDFRNDFDKILQFLAREEHHPQRPPTLDSTYSYMSPRRGSGSPWLPAYDEEPPSFSAQSLLSQSNIPMISMPSSLFSVQRDLFIPDHFTTDFPTSSIIEDMHMHGQKAFVQEENPAHFFSGYSIFQQNITTCDNHRQLRDQIDGVEFPGQSQLVSLPQQDSSAGPSYSFPHSKLQESSGMFQSFNEFLLEDGGAGGGGRGGGGEGGGGGGDGGGSGVLATPANSSLSSSCSEELAVDEESSHPSASSVLQLDDRNIAAGVAGSKRKAAGMISHENLASVSDNKKLQARPVKKGKIKRLREPRYAIQTRSEKDVLEDGYKWRKYGQKSVKNTPHPRSYYRCTYNKCSVKKTVERSCEDSGLVITTYEGTHVHPSPNAIRGPATHSHFLDTIFSRQLYSQLFSSDHRHIPGSDPHIGFELLRQIRSAGASHELPAQLERSILDDMIPSNMHM